MEIFLPLWTLIVTLIASILSCRATKKEWARMANEPEPYTWRGEQYKVLHWDDWLEISYMPTEEEIQQATLEEMRQDTQDLLARRDETLRDYEANR